MLPRNSEANLYEERIDALKTETDIVNTSTSEQRIAEKSSSMERDLSDSASSSSGGSSSQSETREAFKKRMNEIKD